MITGRVGVEKETEPKKVSPGWVGSGLSDFLLTKKIKETDSKQREGDRKNIAQIQMKLK